MKRNTILWILICAIVLLCGILCVGCDEIGSKPGDQAESSNEFIGVNLYVKDQRISYRIVSKGEDIKFPAVTTEGYDQGGWYFDEGVWQEEYSSQALLGYMQKGVASVDLHIKLTPTIYTITYEGVDAEDTSEFPKSFHIESGIVSLPQTVSKVCHIFTGWSMDGASVTEIDPKLLHDVTVTATFEVQHEGVVIEPGYKATCTKEGLSDGSHCTVCGNVLSTQNVIPALGHNYQATWHWQGTESASVDLVCLNDPTHATTLQAEISVMTAEQATCLVEEKTLYIAGVSFGGQSYRDSKEVIGEKIPHEFVSDEKDKVNHTCSMCRQLFPHTDDDIDGVCNDCGLKFETIIRISNKIQLYEITNDLTATYILTENITLDGNWGGIGSTIPFTGKFYGNGKTITALQFSAGGDCGLFVNNSGLIDGLTLSNINLSVSNASATIGGIAAHNYGTIQNCTIQGANTINFSAKWNLTDSNSKSHTIIGGAICGDNQGEIKDCLVEGTMSNVFEVTCYGYHQGMIPGLNPMARVTVDIYYGNVAGQNSGTVSDTKVTCGNSVSLIARASGANPVDGATATMNVKVGSFIGKNSSLLKNCSARAAIIKPETSGDNDHFAYINFTPAPMYENILGEHTGSTEGFEII